VVFALNWETIDKMARDTALGLHALTYVIRLHADITSEHGAPTLGTQNQAVDFILADPDDKHWGSFNEAFSKVATRRAISARSRIPRKNLCQAGLALSRAEGQSQR